MYLDSDISQTDLGVVAALIELGYEPKKLDWATPSRVRFVFDKEEGLEEAIDGYWNGTVKLPASKLISTYKQLKSRLHAGA